MTNAKQELLSKIGKIKILCAEIVYAPTYHDTDNKQFIVKIGHTKKSLKQFFDGLNFEYDSGFGRQYVFGIVWLQDGTWLSRAEYDGQEWWKHNVLPQTPDYLK